MRKRINGLLLGMFCFGALLESQEIPHYDGLILNNPDYHHGQLSPVMGVHNIGVMRANREFPETADNLGWTYNHAPMLVYWNNTYFIEYLSNPVGEHIAPGATLLQRSADGYQWSMPEEIFPPYKIPDGTVKPEATDTAKNLEAVNHQRMGFYVSSDNRLLVLAYIAISMNEKDSPNDGNGIGRVVREIYKDGSLGEISFICYNKGWSEKNTDYPNYKKIKDKGFVKACNELLTNRLVTQHWNEEADRDDPLISLKGDYKAFNYYHLPNGNVVGLWKHALAAISEDEGKTWTKPIRAPGFVNGNAKIWGQKTSDGRYVTVYNPSDFRWPLALSVSNDGLKYDKLLLVNGEISPMRYGGNYKSYGPQYVRGIMENNGSSADGNMWVTYSMNKEDIWISKIPIPVIDKVAENVNDVFNELPENKELNSWNIFSPVWARVSVEKDYQGKRCMVMSDKDAFDYAKAERLFPATDSLSVEFSVEARQNNHGQLNIELLDNKGTAALRLTFDADGFLKQKNGYRMKNIMSYDPNKLYSIRIEANASNRFFYVYINGEKKSVGLCFAPVHQFERITFRTGQVRRFPDVDSPTDQNYDLPLVGKPLKEALFSIYSLTTNELKK